MEVVRLTKEAQDAARACAMSRMNESAQQGISNKNGASRSEKLDMIGAFGEAIVATYLGEKFEGHFNIFDKTIPDVGPYQVRAVLKSDPGTKLLVRPDDDPDAVFIHAEVDDDYTGGTVWGWMFARDAQTEEWKRDPHGRGVCYLVKRKALHSIEELRKGNEMNIETAHAILAAVKDGGYKKDDVPEDDEKAIEEAQFYANHAEALPESDRDDTVNLVLELANDGIKDDGYVPVDQEPTEPLAETDVARTTTHEAPDLPYDITALKDMEVRRLSSRFQVHLNEVTRTLSTCTTQILRAKQLRESEYRKRYVAEANAASDAGKRLTKDLLDMAVVSAPAIQELDNQIFELEVQEREYKALRDIYKGNVERLSRDLTMRMEEMKAKKH